MERIFPWEVVLVIDKNQAPVVVAPADGSATEGEGKRVAYFAKPRDGHVVRREDALKERPAYRVKHEAVPTVNWALLVGAKGVLR